MNTTSDSEHEFFGGPDNVRGFGYGIGVSVGIIFCIIAVALASYGWTKARQRQRALPPSNSQESVAVDSGSLVVDVAGLDEETIKSYPKLMYSEAKRKKKDCADTCCSICLADYNRNDRLRQLPGCGHLFHLKCIDHWLRLHGRPVCRTQLSQPLADDQVVPLPSRPGA
ncbi:putative phosphatidylglycerol/phosphatidylinositol transfer protein [Hibiscus syriacus]|uniref:Phosphatidylglycerol/phosphatidylinositol transfer protein n=1 Tax=Hibiscus syriacus TaxID=106335 RepID=A0A6A2YR58_HIBSY|nr:RING-H2 finger protein ATL70-like [Hibiscus syriacus]KAE8681843.1 putative phosphatidylglycerol/phosphatidylinositol transfer protein [Hibiscus syriacus]